MATNTLNILKPSVNNLTARIFVRAAGLEFEELDVWGETTTPEFLQKDPAHLTPMLEEDGLPQGLALGELRDHAVPLQQARPGPVLPDGSGRAGDGGQRDVLPDRHALSAASRGPPTRRSASRSTRARSATSDADDAIKAQAQQDAEAALAEPLDVYRALLPRRQDVHRRRRPSIADIRLAATLEFLRAIDYPFPAWAEEYMARDGVDARRRLLGAGGGRARLRGPGEGGERVGGRWAGGAAPGLSRATPFTWCGVR